MSNVQICACHPEIEFIPIMPPKGDMTYTNQAPDSFLGVPIAEANETISRSFCVGTCSGLPRGRFSDFTCLRLVQYFFETFASDDRAGIAESARSSAASAKVSPVSRVAVCPVKFCQHVTVRAVGSTLNFLMASSAAWHIMFAATANNRGTRLVAHNDERIRYRG
jgi:hypothetical protein